MPASARESREVPREAKQAPLRFVMQAAELGSPASLERLLGVRVGRAGCWHRDHGGMAMIVLTAISPSTSSKGPAAGAGSRAEHPTRH